MTACSLATCQTSDASNVDFLHLIVRCYSAMIQDFYDAKGAHAEGNEDLLMDRVRHAQDLLTELLIGLDYAQGGEIAVNLGKIYNYMLRELIGLRHAEAQETLDRMIAMAENLQEAWLQVAKVA